MRLKVCGITRSDEIDVLGALPVDLVGLWHGVPGGRADLPLAAHRQLAAAARATRSLEPVFVTFLNDAKAVCEVIHQSQVRWIQLHGYQPPGLVRAVKQAAPHEVRIMKALHVQGAYCPETPLIRAYEKAGVDIFLLDAATDDGRIGSIGQAMDGGVVSALANRLNRPFLLAGDISSESWREHAMSVRNPGWLGIDVDTNARGRDGVLCPDKVETIVRAWTVTASRSHLGVKL